MSSIVADKVRGSVIYSPFGPNSRVVYSFPKELYEKAHTSERFRILFGGVSEMIWRTFAKATEKILVDMNPIYCNMRHCRGFLSYDEPINWTCDIGTGKDMFTVQIPYDIVYCMHKDVFHYVDPNDPKWCERSKENSRELCSKIVYVMMGILIYNEMRKLCVLNDIDLALTQFYVGYVNNKIKELSDFLTQNELRRFITKGDSAEIFIFQSINNIGEFRNFVRRLDCCPVGLIDRYMMVLTADRTIVALKGNPQWKFDDYITNRIRSFL